jgi:hypothetical protein
MRFHSKFHSKNHHTNPTIGYPDSALDPIASHDNPFQGDFVLVNGSIYAPTANFSDGLSSLEVDTLVVNNSLSSLTVGALTTTTVTGNGSGLTNVNAITLNGNSSSIFELISNKNQPFGYAGLDMNGELSSSTIPPNINLTSLNFIPLEQYLLESDLSSTVAPLITSSNPSGYEIPSDYLPKGNEIITSISSSSVLERGVYTTLSLTTHSNTFTLWNGVINDSITFINYSGGSNILSSDDGFKSDSLSSYPSVTINNNEVLKFIFDGTNWLLTT